MTALLQGIVHTFHISRRSSLFSSQQVCLEQAWTEAQILIPRPYCIVTRCQAHWSKWVGRHTFATGFSHRGFGSCPESQDDTHSNLHCHAQQVTHPSAEGAVQHLQLRERPVIFDLPKTTGGPFVVFKVPSCDTS